MNNENTMLDGKIREKWRKELKEFLSKKGLNPHSICIEMEKDGVSVKSKTIYDAIRDENPTSPRSEVMDRIGEWIKDKG